MVDFFISYNHHDTFMARRIKGWLEEEGYSCMMQESDFGTGSNFVLKMDEAAKNAKRTIAVLSPDYLSSKFTQPEWAAAFAKDPTGEFQFLIPVRVKECELEGLLSQIVYLDLVGLSAMEMKEQLVSDIEAILNKKHDPSNLKTFKKAKEQKHETGINQIAKGDGNIQVGRDYIKTEKSVFKNEIVPSGEHITDSQAREIQEMVSRWADIMNKTGKGNGYGEAYSRLKNNFRITSYKLLPREKFQAAKKYIRQQIGRLRPSLRRPNNQEWRKHNYASIYAKSRELGMSKQDVYDLAFQKLALRKPISSLTHLKERQLDALYKIFQRM